MQETTPLKRLVATGEGVLIFGSNLALLLVPIFTSSLSATAAARDAVILNGITIGSRSLLKGVAAFSGASGVAPEQIGAVDPETLSDSQKSANPSVIDIPPAPAPVAPTPVAQTTGQQAADVPAAPSAQIDPATVLRQQLQNLGVAPVA